MVALSGTVKRWNLLRAAALGAVAGLVYVIGPSLLGGSVPLEYMAGQALGGVVAGAVLFGLIAGARNLVLRAR